MKEKKCLNNNLPHLKPGFKGEIKINNNVLYRLNECCASQIN